MISDPITVDLDRRRTLLLAKLLPMLSLMAGGEAAEVEGYDAASLYDETMMALGIEDEDNPDTMAEVIVEMDGRSGHCILDRLTTSPRVDEGRAIQWLRDKAAGYRAEAKRQGKRVGPLAGAFDEAAAIMEREFATTPVDPRVDEGRDTEADAWAWLDRKFGTETDDPADRAYAADEMVDAFHAGRSHHPNQVASEERAREVLAATFEQAGVLPRTVEALRAGGDSLFSDETLTIRAMLRFANEATTDPRVGKMEADDLRIGDKVEVIGDYAETFHGVDTWIAGIRVHDTGEGLDYTLSEQWPVPNRHWSNYRGQTDGFRREQLRRSTLSQIEASGR